MDVRAIVVAVLYALSWAYIFAFCFLMGVFVWVKYREGILDALYWMDDVTDRAIYWILDLLLGKEKDSGNE